MSGSYVTVIYIGGMAMPKQLELEICPFDIFYGHPKSKVISKSYD